MACLNGCIGGPACLTHELKDMTSIDKYGKLAKEQNIKQSVDMLNLMNPIEK